MVLMTERKELRLIREDPVLARIMANIEPRIVPRGVWDWSVSWVEDVGQVMRSRTFWSGNIASLIAFRLFALIGIG